MKFRIETTETCGRINDWYQGTLINAGFILEIKPISDSFAEYYIDISSLKQLVKLRRTVNQEIILRTDGECEVIEIYNAYRD